MTVGSDLMDWEPTGLELWDPANYTPLLKRSRTRLHIIEDWEPQLPGKFPTSPRAQRENNSESPRTSRKRTADEAGLSTQRPDTEDRRPIMSTQLLSSVSRVSNRYASPVLTAASKAWCLLYSIYKATMRGAKATRRGVRAVAQSQRVIEIRRMTNENFMSIKRRVADVFVKPHSNKKRNRRQATPRKPTTPELEPTRASSALNNSNLPTNTTLQRVAQNSSSLKTINSSGPNQNLLDHTEAANASSNFYHTSPKLNQITNSSLRAESGDCSVEPQQADTSEQEPLYMELINELLQKSPSKSSPSSDFDQSELDLLEKFFTPTGLPSVSSINNPSNSYLQLAVQASVDDESSIAHQEHDIQASLYKESTNSKQSATEFDQNTVTPPQKHKQPLQKQKQVRIALDPSTGLPQESVGRFYRESIVGQWAGSSPCTEDAADGASSDLDSTLSSLSSLSSLEEDEDLSLPMTPTSIAEYETDAESSDLDSTLSFLEEDADLPTVPTSIAEGEMPTNAYNISSQSVEESTDQLYENLSPCHQNITQFGEPTQAKIGILSNKCFDVNANDTDSNNEPNIHEEVDQGAISLDYNTRTAEDIVSEVPNMSSGKAQPAQAEEINQYLIELCMSERMSDKIRRGRQAKKTKEMALAATKAEEEAAAAREALAEAEKAQAEAEEAQRQTLPQRRMPRSKLVQPLSLEWAHRINDIIHKGENATLTTTVSGTELKRRDFMTVLGEQRWLNDEIINAYLDWIVEYANEKAGKNGRNLTPKVIAHNSFFYQNLVTKGPASVSRWMKRKRAEGKRLLDVDCVLIPVNSSNHWTLIVVSPTQRTIEYLDSFGGDPRAFVSHTLAWLKVELGDSWNEEEWRFLETMSAQQNNGYDCGVFAVTNAECVVGGVATGAYSRQDMAEQRRRIAAVLLNRGFGGELIPAEDL